MTKHQILDAAERVFHAKGLAGATLADVAKAASVSRGAIYWHFRDKVDVFDAMMQRATLPFEQAWAVRQGHATDSRVLLRIFGMLELVLQSVSKDPTTKRVFEIALFKMEHVGELATVRERRIAASDRFIAAMQQDLAAAALQEGVALRVSALQAAQGLHAIFDGFIQAWLLRGGGFDLEEGGMSGVKAYLAGLGLQE